MASFPAVDIADILSDDVIGEEITVDGVAVRAYVNREYDAGYDGIDRHQLVATIAERDVATGAPVVVGGDDYVITSVRDDGNGFLGLILAEA